MHKREKIKLEKERRVAVQKSKKDTVLEAEYMSTSELLVSQDHFLIKFVIKFTNKKYYKGGIDGVLNTYFTINAPGTVFIWDKDMGKVVFGVRCIPITGISEVAEFGKFYSHVHMTLNFILDLDVRIIFHPRGRQSPAG